MPKVVAKATAAKTHKGARQSPPTQPKVDTPPSVRLRQELGLSRKTFARLTGLSERSLASWEAGAKLNDASRRAVVAAERLLRALAEVIRGDALVEWLDRPNAGFDGLKPVEVLERGEADRLWRMVYHLGSGTAS